jgi:hypothetical protein
MAGKERNKVKRVLFIIIASTALFMCATTTTISAEDTSAEDKLVVPVYRVPGTPEKLVVPVVRLPGTPDKLGVPVISLPPDVVARVNEAYWAEKRSQWTQNCLQTALIFVDFLDNLRTSVSAWAALEFVGYAFRRGERDLQLSSKRSILCCCHPLAAKFSIDSKQVLPLAKVTLEAHAFGNLKSRDQAPLDLFAAFARSLTSWPVFPAWAVEVSREFVVLASLELG